MSADSYSPSTSEDLPRHSIAEIDASCRIPVLFLLTKSFTWLLLGLLFALVASIKMHVPQFIAHCPWMTYGRVRPAAISMLTYGFASQAGLATVLWLFARLGGTRLAYQGPILIGGALWNLGVVVGVVGIFAGGSTGFDLLEMPHSAAAILLLAYLILGTCALLNFGARRVRTLFVSHWYLLAALFWFPWVYSAAHVLLLCVPVRGSLQPAVAAWFANNFLGLWLTPIALALVYYFIPKLAGRPLEGAGLAAFAFWTYGFFMNLAGLAPLFGGPLPLWITSASTMAAGGLLLPVACIAGNWYLTLREDCAPVRADVAGRFALGAGLSFVIAGLLQSLMSCPKIATYTQFTLTPIGHRYLVILGAVGLALFAAMHFIIPRVAGVAWPCAQGSRLHFLLTTVGVALVALPPILGGFLQGSRMHDASLPWNDVIKGAVPFIGMSTLGWLVLLGGQAIFAYNLARLLRQAFEPLRACGIAWMKPAAPSGARAEVNA